MATIDLPARADRAAAETLLPVLRDAAQAGDVSIDGRAVVQLGQAMVQLLIAARRAAETAGHRFVLDPSEAMAATLAMAGAEALLDGAAA